ncbi:MAG: YdcF family protein [Chryseosolibacter sp.]
MFFFLSKTLNYLVMPLTVVMACLILSLIIKHKVWRRRFLIGGLVLFFVFTNDFLANELMKVWEVETKPYSSMRKYKLGIVLTGTVIPQLIPDDRIYFNRGADRVIHTVQLYKLGLVEKILVSGGSGRLVDIGEREADKFKEAMVLMGVPDSVILLENQTRNTHESAVAVQKIMNSLAYESSDCLLITSAFHMRRSLACYKKVGLPVDTFTTDFYAHRGKYYLDAFLLPKIDALVIWHKLVREWVGFIAYWMAGYV